MGFAQEGSNTPPRVKTLIGTLREERGSDWQVPQAAAHQLAEIGAPAVRPLFNAMLASNSNRPVDWMEYALYRMAEQYAGRQEDANHPGKDLIAALDDPRESYEIRRRPPPPARARRRACIP